MKFADIQVGEEYEVDNWTRVRVLETGTFNKQVDRAGRYSMRARMVDVPTKGAKVLHLHRETGEPLIVDRAQYVECEGCIGRGTVTVAIPSFPEPRKEVRTCATCNGTKTVKVATKGEQVEWLESKKLGRTWAARVAAEKVAADTLARQQRAKLEAEQIAPQLKAALEALGLTANTHADYGISGRIVVTLSAGNAAELVHLLSTVKVGEEV